MSATNLYNISPTDGRYANKLTAISEYFSEYALFKYRLEVEILWLIALSRDINIKELPEFKPEEQEYLHNLIKNFNITEAIKIKAIEERTLHDVKAVEYYLHEKLLNHPTLKSACSFIHFALTSEDINNISYALMLKDAVKQIIIPELTSLYTQIIKFAKNHKNDAMLAKTHGQPATPTTVGKEFICFAARLKYQLSQLKNLTISAKCNGAVGNYNAHCIAYPKVDWLLFSTQFINSLGLTCNLYTTQIEPHDCIAEWAHLTIRINNICLDLARDCWLYISLNYFQQHIKPGQIGSSTMPHKINPIDFENAEGNIGLANAMLDHMANKLPISRMQRDLSDSTVLRNLGVACAYTSLAWQSLLSGLTKISINKHKLDHDLNLHWEVLAEAIQTILRRNNLLNAYETLKEFTQGQIITQNKLADFINNLELNHDDKKILLNLQPHNYIGLASALVDNFQP
jgi:adenylosuccinate lyase